MTVGNDIAFSALPPHASRQSYQDAIDCYARKVAPRARAVYLVGNVGFPGLSDIDVLIVMDQSRPDNNQFFSPFRRLPSRYSRLFLHGPFVAPSDMLDVIYHTSHSKRRLLAGADIIGARQPQNTIEEAACRLSESYLNFLRFTRNVLHRKAVSSRLLIAVASSLRYALSDLDMLQHSSHAADYETYIDGVRGAIVDGEGSPQLAPEVWERFCSEVAGLKHPLCRLLRVAGEADGQEAVKAFLNGDSVPPMFDACALAARRSIVRAYHIRLNELQLSYGFLFATAAYADSLNIYRQNTVTKYGAELLYRLGVSP